MSKAISALNDPRLLSIRDAHFARLRGLFDGNKPDKPFMLWGCVGSGQADPYLDPETWMSQAAENLASMADSLRVEEVFRPLTILCGYYGVHFVDRMFGAYVYELRERNNCQVAPLVQRIGNLEPVDLESDETWALARRFSEEFLALDASVPLFGLPTIASALNIGLNLYSQELLIKFLEDPEAIRRDLRTINDALCSMHRWYLEHLPLEQLQPVLPHTRAQPPGYGQLCGSSTQLLPPDLYRDFIAPFDDELLSVYPNGGMIHLCGTHTQHIPIWREMLSLKTIQLNDRASEDLAADRNGKDAGYIQVDKAAESTPLWEVDFVYVSPQMRRRGIGKQLLSIPTKEALDAGLIPLYRER